MPIDPRKLKPAQLVQLLNSTPLGEVANDRTLYRHRARAGLHIGAPSYQILDDFGITECQSRAVQRSVAFAVP